jgi:hypothetical protein
MGGRFSIAFPKVLLRAQRAESRELCVINA